MKPVSARQVSEAIDQDFTLVCKNIKKLLKWKEIKQIEIDRYSARIYLKNDKITRRMNLYFPVDLHFRVDQLVILH